MYAKEFLEARIKFLIFALLVAINTTGNTIAYSIIARQIRSTNATLPTSVASQVQQLLSSFDTYVWGSWFQINGATYLALFGAILGTSLIAGEVSKGSIFFLLSKPVSRDRVLLIKYGVCALLMLIVALIGTTLLFTVGMITGHTLDLSRMLMATTLIWLGTLSVLGLTLMFSVLFSDVLRPALIALSIILVLTLPAFLPDWQHWSLIYYWSSADSYFKGTFPLTNLLVDLAAAILPLIAALILFRRKAY